MNGEKLYPLSPASQLSRFLSPDDISRRCTCQTREPGHNRVACIVDDRTQNTQAGHSRLASQLMQCDVSPTAVMYTCSSRLCTWSGSRLSIRETGNQNCANAMNAPPRSSIKQNNTAEPCRALNQPQDATTTKNCSSAGSLSPLDSRPNQPRVLTQCVNRMLAAAQAPHCCNTDRANNQQAGVLQPCRLF